VIALTLARIAGVTGARMDLVTDPGAAVTGPVVIDSRACEPGALFAALPGERVDGHDFAAAAVAAGAVAVLADRPVGVPALVTGDVQAALGKLARAVVDALPGLTVAGITGSTGKTTTKDLAGQLVERLGPTIAPRGSLNNEIGLPLTVLRATRDTRYLVLEYSTRNPGDITYLCGIAPPRLGVVLCVGASHVGEFGSLAAIARAKAELPAALPPDGVALLNADDPSVRAMSADTKARVVTFGRDPAATVRAQDVRLDDQGRPEFTLITSGGAARTRLRLVGAHNVVNALAAAALAGELGLAPGAVAEALATAEPRSRWRMEVTRRPDGVTVINDAYNSSPDSVAAALATLARLARGKRAFAVLGPMNELGDQSWRLHEEAGGRAAQAGVDGLIVVGEAAAGMMAGARAQRSWHGELLAVADGPQALKALGNLLAPGDVVLVKASRTIGLERVALALTGEASL
jgi:UDP-N-acetylmuramoyl-tripeptide--D-alanyl-D-alanine ligase